ncbi:hypothetical protein CBL_12377 [Carabus blaptoides fortunei]
MYMVRGWPDASKHILFETSQTNHMDRVRSSVLYLEVISSYPMAVWRRTLGVFGVTSLVDAALNRSMESGVTPVPDYAMLARISPGARSKDTLHSDDSSANVEAEYCGSHYSDDSHGVELHWHTVILREL